MRHDKRTILIWSEGTPQRGGGSRSAAAKKKAPMPMGFRQPMATRAVTPGTGGVKGIGGKTGGFGGSAGRIIATRKKSR